MLRGYPRTLGPVWTLKERLKEYRSGPPVDQDPGDDVDSNETHKSEPGTTGRDVSWGQTVLK